MKTIVRKSLMIKKIEGDKADLQIYCAVDNKHSLIMYIHDRHILTLAQIIELEQLGNVHLFFFFFLYSYRSRLTNDSNMQKVFL